MNSNIANSSLSSLKPRLTVICLCYNQKPFLKAALDSVFQNKTEDTEVIFVDDASVDGSQDLFNSLKHHYQFKDIILNQENKGSCKAFNEALEIAEGKYIIDFACDDLILNNLEERISFFEKQDDDVAMTFCNAQLISFDGKSQGYHYPVDNNLKSINKVPDGNVFLQVLKGYYICTPTMLFSTASLRAIGGYDERLDYEDFDTKTKLAKNHKFIYDDRPHIARRGHNQQMSRGFFSNTRGEGMSKSTLIIFQRLKDEVVSNEEIKALCERCLYEGRNASFFHYSSQKGFKEILTYFGFWNYAVNLKWKIFYLSGSVGRFLFSKI